MADGDPGNDQPSLELPKLGLRRRRKKNEPTPEPADTSADDTVALPPTPAPTPTPTPTPTAEPTVAFTPAPAPPQARAPEREETAPPLFVDEVEPLVVPEPRGATVAVDDATDPAAAEATGETVDDAEADDESTAERASGIRLPGGMPAAVLTGVAVGLGMVGLTKAGLQVCETVQGTSSCGGTGYPMLAAILVLMVVGGGLLLRAAKVPDPLTTSFLAVGLTAVLALLFLVDSLMDPAMIVVIPAIAAGSYAVAHWVTRTFIEPAEL